jgi:hypothetical protein
VDHYNPMAVKTLQGNLVPIPVGSIASLIGQANPIALAGLSKKP